MILDYQITENSVIVSYFNKDGKTSLKQFPTGDNLIWSVCSASDKKASKHIKNWDGRSVKRTKAKTINQYTLEEMFLNLSEEDSNELFAYNLPEKYFIDIETEIDPEGFPEPSEAKMPITAICIVTPKNQCIVLGTKDLSKNEQFGIHNEINTYLKEHNISFTFNYKKFETEYDLLYTFLKVFVRNMPILSGWNVVNFDWQYIYNRAKRLNIDPSISSPNDKLKGLKYDNTYLTVPANVGIIDYMFLYKSWDRSDYVKESASLDYAANKILGISKIKYTGTLQDLYENDFNKYIFYNAIDTCIVKLIDMKLETMDVLLTLCHMCKVPIDKANAPVYTTELLLLREYLKHDMVIGDEYIDRSSKDTQYAGAFVKDPKVGLHHSVVCCDYASLYPSIMRSFNISPESYIEKINNIDLIESRKNEDVIITSIGTVFKKEKSILKGILDDIYQQRKDYKKISKDAEKMVLKLEQELKKLN